MPLVLLAIPSLVIGYLTIGPMLHGDFFKGVIAVADAHTVMAQMGEVFREHHGALGMASHALMTPPFWLAAAGVALAWFLYIVKPELPALIRARAASLYALLDNKYYLDRFNEVVFAGGARLLGSGLWKGGDVALIDGLIVNGSARLVGFIARVTRFFQTGHLYHYAFVMIVAVWFAITRFAFLGSGPGK